MSQLPPTEQRNPLSTALDSLTTLDMVRLMNRLDATIPAVIAETLPQIAQTVGRITSTLENRWSPFLPGRRHQWTASRSVRYNRPTFSALPGAGHRLDCRRDAATMLRSVEGRKMNRTRGSADTEL
ncbi:MAG: hypothetical protein R3E79_39965 [Caldilineaceae bacterium]